MNAKVAFAISNEFPNLTDDDRLAANALDAMGIRVDPVLWDDPRADWASYAAVVIRSCWDYHTRAEEFARWLDAIEHAGVTLWNPADLVRWNMDKNYLSELQDLSVPVLPSVWLPRGAKVNLQHLMKEKSWPRAVVKPTVSAAADQTSLIEAQDAPAFQDEFAALSQKGGVIVQEFADEIRSTGEWSLIFFGNEHSHAVVKRPQAGDFRVQRNYGGTAAAAQPPAHLLAQARQLLNLLEADLLYARLDGIERQGEFLLMELEIIEPHLFFEQDSQAPRRFAQALAKTLAIKE